MKPRVFLLLAAALWQLARFAIVGVLLMWETTPEPSIGDSLLFLWLPSSQLVLVAALVMLALVPAVAAAYRRLVIFGKVFDIVPGAAVLIYQARAVFFGASPPLFGLSLVLERFSGGTIGTAITFYFLAVTVVLLDLMALLIVISCRSKETEPSQEGVSLSGNLPDFNETHLED